jgi:uncharacterized membrane protein YuzA (DUF378 family)
MREIKQFLLKPLVLIGALNWGMIGLINYDLLSAIFGVGSMASRVVFILIGLSAIVCIISMMTDDK